MLAGGLVPVMSATVTATRAANTTHNILHFCCFKKHKQKLLLLRVYKEVQRDNLKLWTILSYTDAIDNAAGVQF